MMALQDILAGLLTVSLLMCAHNLSLVLLPFPRTKLARLECVV